MFRLRLAVAVALGLAACGPAAPEPEPVTLTVFAAASLTEAFTEIGRQYEAAHPGVSVLFNFAGSHTLRGQLEQGAVADVFAAANAKEMEAAVEAGLVSSDGAVPFLRNRLIVILPSDNPARIESPADLARPDLKLVLAAEEAPVGSYSRQALARLNALYGDGYAADVLGNVVSNEDNVRQVVAKVELGEADAGIVYGSDAVAAPQLTVIEIPTGYNVAADYPIAPLLAAPNPAPAAEFVAYVLSPAGQAILQKWGFTPISP